jgi:hypothetical protein
MRYHVSIFVLVSVFSLVSVGFSQGASGTVGGPAPAATTAPVVTGSAAYPYDAEITGNDVNYRSGAGTGYYECGKLFKGDKVKVMGDMDGVWSKIQPPTGSFSWISAQYVKIDPADQTIGTITGDEVRVWAGSERVRPEASTSLQGKLSKGAKVKLLGEQLNNYYKIAVPSLPDAYYWISTQYTKPIAPNVPDVVKTTVNTGSGTSVPSETAVSVTVDANAAPVPEEIHVPTQLDKYYELQKQMDVERTKPLSEQNYSTFKEAFKAIIDSNDAGKAKDYSKIMLDRIKGIELALSVGDLVKQQNEQLKQANDKIEKAYTQKIDEFKDMGKFAVMGKLQNFLSLGSGNYRIVDDSDQTICYAAPGQGSAGQDLSSYIGKKVGLVGTIESHLQTSGALVRFTKIVSLE